MLPAPPGPPVSGTVRDDPAAPGPFRPLLDLDAIVAAAEAAGVRFDRRTATLDEAGFNCLVCHAVDEAGRPWILRAPRRADMAEKFASEAHVLRLVRDRLPVRVPDWQIYTPTLIGYPRLAGTPVVTVEATGPVWRGVDRQAPSSSLLTFFGQLLASLQAISPEDPAAEAVTRTTIAAERQALGRTLDAVRTALAPSDRLWAHWQRWLADDASWPTHTALVHGDLHPGHWLLEESQSNGLLEEHRITGLLDWTEARFADPSIDFAMLFGRFGEPALRVIVQAFADAGGRTFPSLVRHAQERWSVFPVFGAEWALHAGNDVILGHMRSMVAAKK
jgi:aminoglycoside phosphotransferase (APT) family kinase protein